MVIRLFVQPGEGKHWIVPKRPEPLAANATVTYTVLSSTILAGTYASYAKAHARNSGHAAAVSTPALFVRASAKAGVCFALGGAAVNWYYHYAFTRPVCNASKVTEGLEWKLWERTERYTVDDGFLAGAVAGAHVGVALLYLRRFRIPWWTKILGMTNIGGATGIVAANGYFQYTGERQKSALALQQWHHRRNIEFHYIYWNKLLMSRLSKPVQAYIMFQGMFHAARIGEEVYEKPEKFGLGVISDTSLPKVEDKEKDKKEDSTDSTEKIEKPADGEKEAEKTEEEQPKQHYYTPDDPVPILENVTQQSLSAHLDGVRQERAELCTEANFIMREISRLEYIICHLDNPSPSEKQSLLRELQMYQVIFTKLSDQINLTDRRLRIGSQRLRQKASQDNDSEGKGDIETWLFPVTNYDENKHEPKLALPHIEAYTETSLPRDIKQCEEYLKTKNISDFDKKRLTKDLNDAHELLKASDKIVFDLNKRIRPVEEVKEEVPAMQEVKQVEAAPALREEKQAEKAPVAQESQKSKVGTEERTEKARSKQEAELDPKELAHQDAKPKKEVVKLQSKQVKNDDMESSKP